MQRRREAPHERLRAGHEAAASKITPRVIAKECLRSLFDAMGQAGRVAPTFIHADVPQGYGGLFRPLARPPRATQKRADAAEAGSSAASEAAEGCGSERLQAGTDMTGATAWRPLTLGCFAPSACGAEAGHGAEARSSSLFARHNPAARPSPAFSCLRVELGFRAGRCRGFLQQPRVRPSSPQVRISDAERRMKMAGREQQMEAGTSVRQLV